MIHQTSPACGSLPIEVAEPKGAKHIDLPVNDVNWAQDTIGIRPLDNLCEGGHWSRWSGENPWCFGSLIVYKSPEVGFHHLPASTGLRISKWLLPGGHLEGDGWRVHHLVAMPFVIHQSSDLSDSIRLNQLSIITQKKQKIIMICGPYIWAAHTSGSHSLAAVFRSPLSPQDMLDGKLKLEKLPRIHVVLHQGSGKGRWSFFVGHQGKQL